MTAYTEKDSIIAGRVLAVMSEYQELTGTSYQSALQFAFDLVLGGGAYDKFVSDLYDNIRAKAGVSA